MAEFPDTVRIQALQRAAFKCVLCKDQVARQVHHIVPPSEGGTDGEENAAPLCPQCHEDHGNDSRWRGFIREARDDWYRKVERMYQPAAVQIIQKAYFSVEAAEEHPDDLPRLYVARSALAEYYDVAMERISQLRDQAARAHDVSDLRKNFETITSGTALGSAVAQAGPGIVYVSGNRTCDKCQRKDIPSDASFCPGCGGALPKTL